MKKHTFHEWNVCRNEKFFASYQEYSVTDFNPVRPK